MSDPNAPFFSNQTIVPNPNSTRPVYETNDSKIFGQPPSKIRCLTIKIRYQQGYPISDFNKYQTLHTLDQFGRSIGQQIALTEQSFVTELVYQRFKHPDGAIKSKIVKVKRKHVTAYAPSSQEREYL